MSVLSWRAVLTRAGQHGPAMLVTGAIVGVAFPGLADAARPAMPFAVFVFTFGAFLKVDLPMFRATIQNWRWVTAGVLWTTLGVPAMMVALLALVQPDTDLSQGMILCALAPPVGSAAAIAAMLGLDTAFALLASVVATMLSPFLLPPLMAAWSGAAILIDPLTMMLRRLSLSAARAWPPRRRGGARQASWRTTRMR